MGADVVINPAEYGDDAYEAVVRANDDAGIDIVVEMSGAPQAITTGFKSVRNGGTVVLFGIPAEPVEIDVAENMIFKNVTVHSINGRRIFDTWYKTRWLLEEGVIDLRPLITKTISLTEIDASMPMLADGSACKLVVVPEHKAKLKLSDTQVAESPPPDIEGVAMHI